MQKNFFVWVVFEKGGKWKKITLKKATELEGKKTGASMGVSTEELPRPKLVISTGE
jgi:hypothetical protein